MAVEDWERYLEEQWRQRMAGETQQPPSLEERIAALEQEIAALRVSQQAKQPTAYDGARQQVQIPQQQQWASQQVQIPQQQQWASQQVQIPQQQQWASQQVQIPHRPQIEHPVYRPDMFRSLPGGIVATPFMPAGMRPSIQYLVMPGRYAMPQQPFAPMTDYRYHQPPVVMPQQREVEDATKREAAGATRGSAPYQHYRIKETSYGKDGEKTQERREEAKEEEGRAEVARPDRARSRQVEKSVDKRTVRGYTNVSVERRSTQRDEPSLGYTLPVARPPWSTAEYPIQRHREDPDLRQLRLELRRLGQEVIALRRQIESHKREFESAIAGE